MDKKIDVSTILENLGSTIKSVASIKSNAETIDAACDNIIEACDTLNYYNGKQSTAKQTYERPIGSNIQEVIYWNVWTIENIDDVENKVEEISKLIGELKTELSTIVKSSNNIEASMLSIENYNDLINKLIKEGGTIATETLTSAFETLKNNIAWDEYSAAKGAWVGVSSENEKWWTDLPIRFRKDEKTGAYLVEQQDGNGNWVGMGWTDEKTAQAYISAVGGSLDGRITDTDNSTKSDSISKTITDLDKSIDDINDGTISKNIKISEKQLRELQAKTNRSPVEEAIVRFYKDIGSAEKSTVTDNMFATTKKVTDAKGTYYLTHIVIKDPSQIVVGNGNGGYGKGLETTSSMAKKMGATIAINGSHFAGDGSQDIKNTGTLTLAINDGKIVENYGASKGMEICIDKNGKIFSPTPGTTAQQLIDMGVTNTFSSHDIPLIKNGQIQYGDGSAAWNEALSKAYNRTILAMKEPGEYYILTGNTSNMGAAEILQEQGVTYAKSLDQGGSTTLVYNNELVNTPTDNTGERAVGDAIGFRC